MRHQAGRGSQTRDGGDEVPVEGAESSLRDSEEQLERMFNSSSSGIAFTDLATGRIHKVNDTWVRETGVPRSRAIGRTATELGLWASPQDRADCMAALEREGRLREYETSLVLRGERHRYAISVEHLYLRQGRFLLWEFRDIGDRERATQEIALLKRSIDIHPDAAYWMDIEGRFVYLNEAGARVLGYRPDELLKMTVYDVNPSATPELMRKVWDTIRSSGFRSGESVHRRKDGSEFPVEILTTYVVVAGKEYACGFARDISERKQHEAERARLQEQLAQAQKMESVGRLAGGVAHDFNNMLGVILAHAEMALETPDLADAIHKSLTTIRTAAERSAALTKQLLAFARKQTVAPKVADLNETVAGMLKMVRRLIGENIRLAWHPGEDVQPVFVDSAQIDQILANLCVNARDAIADVGTITIQTGMRVVPASNPGLVEAGEYVWLTVSDDGCGMDAATQAQAFDPFFTTKGVGKGTGLGLSTVYGIVKQNRGFIEMHSEVGRGTRVAIHLPRHVGARAQDPSAPHAHTAGCETILLVEDERVLAEVATRILVRKGYRVITALTPGEAIRLAREHTTEIHLLITDVVMPEMNGRDLAKVILSLYPTIKRLFMSGYTADVIADRGVLNEGVSFIQKPFSIQDLVAKVREVLGASDKS